MGLKEEEKTGGGRDPQELSIEESFERLERILAEMEDEKTGLEDSFRLYEEGVRLLKHAEESVDRVEQKIRILSGKETEEDL